MPLRWLVTVTVLAAAAGGADLLAADGGFEVGGSGLLLRTGTVEPSPRRAALDDGSAAEGRWSLRLTPRDEDPPVAVEVPWRRLDPSARVTLSAWLRTNRSGLFGELVAVDAAGAAQVTRYPLTRDWRRYAATFRVPPDSAQLRFELRGSGGEARFDPGSVWVDGLRLEAGEATPYEATPALGARVVGRRLRRAGERADFDLLLRVPGGDPAATLDWRLEDALGVTVRNGRLLLEVPARERAQARVRLETLGPGAWRLVATCDVAGRVLRADASLVVVATDLAGPVGWCGVTDAAGEAGLAAVELLSVGLHRPLVTATAAAPGLSPHVLRRLVVEREAGVGRLGELPEPVAGTAYETTVRDAVAPLRRLIGTWVVPEAVAADPALLTAAVRGAKAADRGAFVLGARALVGRPLPAAGELGDGVVLPVVGDVPADLSEVVAAWRGELARRPQPAQAVVLLTGWPAAPWSGALPAAPGSAALEPLAQASHLARAVILARAGGAAGVLYGGAPLADRPAALTCDAAGRTPDLFACDGTPLPAVAALDHALDRLRGRVAAAAWPTAPGMRVRVWQGRRPLATLWQTARPGQRVTVVVPLPAALLSATDLCGAPVALRGATETRLPLTAHPLYLESGRVSDEAFAAALRAATAASTP